MSTMARRIGFRMTACPSSAQVITLKKFKYLDKHLFLGTMKWLV